MKQLLGAVGLDHRELLNDPASQVLPADDPRVLGTIWAVRNGLMEAGLVKRGAAGRPADRSRRPGGLRADPGGARSAPEPTAGPGTGPTSQGE